MSDQSCHFHSLSHRLCHITMAVPGFAEPQTIPALNITCPLADRQIDRISVSIPLATLNESVQELSAAAGNQDPHPGTNIVSAVFYRHVPMLASDTHDPGGQVMRVGHITLKADVKDNHILRGTDMARFMIEKQTEDGNFAIIADMTMPLHGLVRSLRAFKKKDPDRIERITAQKQPVATAIFAHSRVAELMQQTS